MRWRVLLVVLLSVASFGAFAAEVELHYFWSTTCPDCAVMKAFLAELAQEYPTLKVIDYNVAAPANWQRMVTLARVYGLTRERTPTVVVGGIAVSGIGRAVELQIREEVERCLAEGCPSPLARLTQRLQPVLRILAITAIVVGGGVLSLVVGIRWRRRSGRRAGSPRKRKQHPGLRKRERA